MERLGRNRRSNSVGESPNLLLTMEGQTKRQIDKGSKLKFTLFFSCDGISLCEIVAQGGENLTLSMWKMVLGIWHT
jgi:hypothetical protein